MEDELIGTTLGGCRITALLGQGGMARVYRAFQERLDREVALKVLPPFYASDPTFVERFELEARAMARLQHPNIVTIYDTGQHQQWLYIVMQLIAGGNLRQRMEQPIRISEVAHIFHDVAEALSYAHEHGIIHRDVKPVNVLLDTSHMDPFPRAVLTDFGIAKMLETSAHLTRTGAGVGTPEYMSPEQCRGLPIDQRADIYALGVLLYEMLCGRPPFVSEEFTAVAHSHIYDPVPPPSLYNQQINPTIQAVIVKALQKKPEQRFNTAREMAAALDEAVSKSVRPATRPAQVECPRCHTMNPIAMNFCAHCGANLRGGPDAPLPAAMLRLPALQCLACGTMNPGANRYCIRCGARLATVICANCGRVCSVALPYCATCGHALPSAS
jgi:serine/threonine protein kinase